MCVAECDWHIGMLDRRCVKPLPSSLPSVTNIEKGKQLLCARTHTRAHSHNTTPTFSISFYLCQLSEGLLGQLSVSSGQLLLQPLTHVQTCPLSPPVFICLYSSKTVTLSLFSFFSYCYPPFTHHLRAQCLFSSFQDPVCLLVQENLCN